MSTLRYRACARGCAWATVQCRSKRGCYGALPLVKQTGFWGSKVHGHSWDCPVWAPPLCQFILIVSTSSLLYYSLGKSIISVSVISLHILLDQKENQWYNIWSAALKCIQWQSDSLVPCDAHATHPEEEIWMLKRGTNRLFVPRFITRLPPVNVTESRESGRLTLIFVASFGISSSGAT